MHSIIDLGEGERELGFPKVTNRIKVGIKTNSSSMVIDLIGTLWHPWQLTLGEGERELGFPKVRTTIGWVLLDNSSN